jgi:tRNA(Ile)-lysidine synthase
MAFESFHARLANCWLPTDWKDLNVLVAVSGGGDSVALLLGLAAIRLPGEGRLIVAHINHKLRGRDSDADQAFVEELSRQLGLSCEVATAAVSRETEACRQGAEAAARRTRYELLDAAAGRLGARFVVTAHTADDQVETILHRILRGTGIRGLSGMSRSRRLGLATLLRPLLGFRRVELAEYLRDRGQAFRTDSSNDDTRFTRNRIRKDLLPLLTNGYNPNIFEALLRLGSLAGEAQRFMDAMVQDLAEKCRRSVRAEEVALDLKVLAAQPRYLVRELLIDVWRRQGWPLMAMGYSEWESVADMVFHLDRHSASVPRKRLLPGAVAVEVRGCELWLSATSQGAPEHAGHSLGKVGPSQRPIP